MLITKIERNRYRAILGRMVVDKSVELKSERSTIEVLHELDPVPSIKKLCRITQRMRGGKEAQSRDWRRSWLSQVQEDGMGHG
jgi:hypothetical protein